MLTNLVIFKHINGIGGFQISQDLENSPLNSFVLTLKFFDDLVVIEPHLASLLGRLGAQLTLMIFFHLLELRAPLFKPI